MGKRYVDWSPGQSFLLPPSPLEWLPEGHLAYFVLDVVNGLKLEAIEAEIQAKDARGNRPFSPRMLVAVLVYGLCVGVRSSRKLEQSTHVDVAFRVLAGGAHPDHSVISEFRRQHLGFLEGLFVEVLRLCQMAKIVKLGHVALDGTKMKANASKHKAMSYERMMKSEEELRAEVKKMLEEAEQVDREEDELYGKDKCGDELPDELLRRETRLKAIRRAREALEAEAAQARAKELEERAKRAGEKAAEAEEAEREKAERAAEEAKGKAEEAAKKAKAKAEERLVHAEREAAAATSSASTRAEQCAARTAEREVVAAQRHLEKVTQGEPPEGKAAEPLPEHQVAADAEGNPKPKAQRNFTDPDSRIMKAGGDYVQGYNAQAAVSEGHQVIVAQAVTNQPPDVEHLKPMVNEVEKNCGRLPEVLTADAGYWSEENANFCAAKGLDAYIAVKRQEHVQGETAQTTAPQPTSENEARAQMRQKLTADKGRKAYARRKAVVEPVFGQIKDARGIRSFLLRGLDKVRGEWALICATHNLLKLWKAVAHLERQQRLALLGLAG
jgi:transposase